MLGLPKEQELVGHGVSTCATCDGFFFRDHDIAVIGGGDSAVEEANVPHQVRPTVTLVHRRDELRASKIMQERALANEKIHIRLEHGRRRHRGRQHRHGAAPARHRHRRGRATSPSPACSSPSATGPNTDLFKGQLDHGRDRLPRSPAHGPPPTSRASSPAATCRTRSTARPSPPPAPAAWRPSTPSAGWSPGTDQLPLEGLGPLGVAPRTAARRTHQGDTPWPTASTP